jgi:uncharacterized membrane protein
MGVNFMSPLLIQFIIFGCIGLIAENIYTAIKGLWYSRDIIARGNVSLWMFPLYGLVAILLPVIEPYVSEWSWPIRGVAYLLGIWSVEYIAAEIFKRLLRKPIWQYSGRFSIHGNVNLLHAPFFFAFGLILEWLYPRVVVISELGLF